MVELYRPQAMAGQEDGNDSATSAMATERKREILECAIRLILDEGMTRVTIRRVARAARVSTGLVLYHFATKEELIAEAWWLALSQAREKIRAAVGEVQGRDLMEAIFRFRFQDDEATNVPWIFWLEYWSHAARTEELRLHHSQTYSQMQGMDLEQVRTAMAAGQIREDLDPAMVVDLFHAIFCGLIVKVVLDKESITGQRALDLGRLFLSLIAPPEPAKT
jgi:AcrR family transcriptional regulator